jgi:tetratricopeptide (TPR) repeat protein
MMRQCGYAIVAGGLLLVDIGCGRTPQPVSPQSSSLTTTTTIPRLAAPETASQTSELTPFDVDAPETQSLFQKEELTPEALIQQAHQALLAGKLQEAAEGYETVLATQRDNLDVLLGLGTARLRLEQYHRALPIIEKALRIDPNNGMGLELLGLVEVRRHRYSAALDQLNAAEKQGRKSMALYLGRSQAYAAAGNHPLAIQDTITAEELGCQDPMLFALRCSSALYAEEWSIAEVALLAAVERDVPESVATELRTSLEKRRPKLSSDR